VAQLAETCGKAHKISDNNKRFLVATDELLRYADGLFVVQFSVWCDRHGHGGPADELREGN
jgi:hypothetical protein